jgi:hypothetical protein
MRYSAQHLLNSDKIYNSKIEATSIMKVYQERLNELQSELGVYMETSDGKGALYTYAAYYDERGTCRIVQSLCG